MTFFSCARRFIAAGDVGDSPSEGPASSYGLRLANVFAVRVRGNTISAGAGGSGQFGSTPPSENAGGNGSPGSTTTNSGGAGGAAGNPNGDTNAGGRGGDGGAIFGGAGSAGAFGRAVPNGGNGELGGRRGADGGDATASAVGSGGTSNATAKETDGAPSEGGWSFGIFDLDPNDGLVPSVLNNSIEVGTPGSGGQSGAQNF